MTSSNEIVDYRYRHQIEDWCNTAINSFVGITPKPVWQTLWFEEQKLLISFYYARRLRFISQEHLGEDDILHFHPDFLKWKQPIVEQVVTNQSWLAKFYCAIFCFRIFPAFSVISAKHNTESYVELTIELVGFYARPPNNTKWVIGQFLTLLKGWKEKY